MSKINQYPVMGYKISVVNGANLNQVEVNGVIQFIYASKRLSRAIRKARLMSATSPNIMLFGQRENGEHFPVSYRNTAKPMFTGNTPHSSRVMVGLPAAESNKLSKVASILGQRS